ncbi:MAG TPA: hypothetical protein VFW38_05450 [Solirubrobacteraceae bacterium]|nr:hypothetical protein [Solirubrobacteraceae bacterium]
MPEIAEPLSPVRVLATPKKFAPLKSFSAGRKGNPWEKFINDWARSTYLGTYLEPQTVVVLEDSHGKLIGIGSFRPKPLPGSERLAASFAKVIGQSHYVHTVAIDRLYRGQRSSDGLRLGDLLLAGVLDQVEIHTEHRTPAVWALVAPENGNARALFRRNDFEELPYTGEGAITYARSTGGNTAFNSGSTHMARGLRRLLGKAKVPPPPPPDAATPPRPA